MISVHGVTSLIWGIPCVRAIEQEERLRLLLDAKQGIRVRTHVTLPLFLYLLAVSTTPGRHSEALTSCHSPLSGSCSFIQSGYSDQRTSRPRRPAHANTLCSGAAARNLYKVSHATFPFSPIRANSSTFLGSTPTVRQIAATVE